MQSRIRKRGYTLVEVLVTLTLSFIVVAALFTVYYWSASIMRLCSKKNHSQVAAIHSSVRIMDCIRNASAFTDYDTEEGLWIELKYSEGERAILAYTNSTPNIANSGGLALFREGQDPIWFAKTGVAKMMSEDGYGRPVFSFVFDDEDTEVTPEMLAGYKKVYVTYRTSQPATAEGPYSTDKNYAMHARFAVCLRNWGEE
jgi:hypothetical protein